MTNGGRSQADRDAVDAPARLTATEPDHTPEKPRNPPLPRPFAVRVWRWVLLGVVAITALLVVGIVRSGLPPPAPQAGIPAGPAQPGGNQPAGGSAAQPGGDQDAGAQQQGGGSPGGAIPADCLVPGDKITITLENSEWTETSDQTIGGYEIFLANGTDKQICVLEHFTSQNSRNDPASRPPNGWTSDCNWFAASGESQGQDHHPVAGAEFWRGEYADDCYFDYPDRIVAVYYDKCPAILKPMLEKLQPDQRGSILDPYAWDLPVLGRAQGFACQ
jgi:hypothetical protein